MGQWSYGLFSKQNLVCAFAPRWFQRPEEPVEQDDEPPRILKEVGQVGKVLCRDCLTALSSQTLERQLLQSHAISGFADLGSSESKEHKVAL